MIFKSLSKKAVTEHNNKPEVIVQTPSIKDRIKNIIDLGFTPQCIFDCGASVGYWSYEASKLFPGAQIVAIEPNSLVIPKAEEILGKIKPPVIIEQCALGATEGKAYLNIFWNEDHTKMSASSLKDHVQGAPEKKLEVRLDTLDNICEKYGVVPDFLKLDLQGGELEALKGAERVLESAEVILTEFGCLEAYVNRTTPYDLFELMYKNDYCLYDIIDLLYRPYDNALTGGDFIFVKNDSPLKKYKGYK